MKAEHLISAMTSIPALVSALANTVGFTTDNTVPDQPLITAPPTGAETFRIRATSTDLIVEPESTAIMSGTAYVRRPTINAVQLAPTKVTIFGGLDPEPYIAVVIWFGDNLFRHLYFGSMEKVGDYSGGEVFSSANGPIATYSQGGIGYRDMSRVHYLFGARQTVVPDGQVGGVKVVHGDNPSSFRRFRGPTDGLSGALTNFSNDDVIGGFGDDMNDGYMARARSPFAGVSPLVPINLFAPIPIVGDVSLRPLGCPAGVRMVNMRDLPIEAEIEISGETWHVYPAFARSVETVMPLGTGNWRTFETSYMVGYAYLE